MLDTIALSLNHTEFEVTDMARFSPSAQGLYTAPFYQLGGRSNFSCYQNPTKTELSQGIYKPRLTLTKRKAHVGYTTTLRIEFSAPKLLFGNNFSELHDRDFPRLLAVLHNALADMGVRVKKETLKKANVSAIHYSKNIPLMDYTNCSMILGELAKINLNKRLDLSKTDYRNSGHAIRYHANSYELTFYDKIKDMQQAKGSEKRAIESDNIVQMSLFESLNTVKMLDVLRMELRLGNRTKIKNLLQTLNLTCPMEFESLFSQAIAKKMLLHFWHIINQDLPMLALSHFKPEDVYYALMTQSGGTMKPAKALQHIGALAILQTVGYRGLRSLMSTNSNDRTWQRTQKELKEIELNLNTRYVASKNVQRCLDVFEPLDIKDYADNKMAGVDMTLSRGTDATSQPYKKKRNTRGRICQ